MIFLQPKIMDAKRSQGGSLSWCQSFAKALGFTVSVNTNKSNSATRETSGVEEGQSTIRADLTQHDTESEPGRSVHFAPRGDCKEETDVEADQ